MLHLNYLSEILAFYNWITFNSLPPDAQALWHALLYLNNRCAIKFENVWYWRVEFTITNSTLISILGFSRQQLDRMRNILIQSGRIMYKKGKGNQCGTYKLIPFGANYVTQTVTQLETQTDTQVWSQTGQNHGTLINNNIYPPNVNSNSFFDGDDEQARPRENDGVENLLSDYLEDINTYFGMTEALKGEITTFTEKMFKKFFGRVPTQQDIIQTFHHVRVSKQKLDGTWQVYLDEEKLGIAEYAFNAASDAGALNWSYLRGVFIKIQQRGLKSRDDCECYDFDHDRLGGRV